MAPEFRVPLLFITFAIFVNAKGGNAATVQLLMRQSLENVPFFSHYAAKP